MYKLKHLILIIATLLLTACASNNIKINIKAAHYLNPNTLGQSEPLRLQIYELSAADKFINASINNITSNPDKYLASTLLDKTVIDVMPKQSKQVVLSRLPSVNYIGVIAYYRNNATNNSKQIIKLIKSNKKTLMHHGIHILLNTHNVIITKQ